MLSSKSFLFGGVSASLLSTIFTTQSVDGNRTFAFSTDNTRSLNNAVLASFRTDMNGDGVKYCRLREEVNHSSNYHFPQRQWCFVLVRVWLCLCVCLCIKCTLHSRTYLKRWKCVNMTEMSRFIDTYQIIQVDHRRETRKMSVKMLFTSL